MPERYTTRRVAPLCAFAHRRDEAARPDRGASSEAQMGLDEELPGFDGGIGLERKRQVDMRYAARGAAVVQDAQPEADIAQPSRVDGILVDAAPGAAVIEEDGAADPEQAERKPVGIGPLFHGKQRSVRAGLITQGIAAQT